MKDTVIILHEVYGITDNLLKLSLELEMNGYNVVLPSLYSDNYVGTNEEYSYKKFFTEVGIDEGLSLLEKIIGENVNSNIIIIGFSIGATLAWLKSTDKRVKMIIGFYGSRIRHYKNIIPTVPVRLFFCDEKSFDVNSQIRELQEKNNIKIEKISGEHGFYSREKYESDLIKETNRRISAELESYKKEITIKHSKGTGKE